MFYNQTSNADLQFLHYCTHLRTAGDTGIYFIKQDLFMHERDPNQWNTCSSFYVMLTNGLSFPSWIPAIKRSKTILLI